jgi:hypothetical protein
MRREAETCADEIEILCSEIVRRARVTGDQSVLTSIEGIKQRISALMAKEAETLRELLADIDGQERPKTPDVLADALEYTANAEASMKATRDSLVLLRDRLKRLKEPQ